MADTLAPGTVLHGRYHIEEMLQSGAHGAIYLGTDAQAAAKAVIVHEGLDPSPEAQARFEEEARVLSSLEHPALPVVIDHFVEESGQQYLITERVEGVTLEQVLTQTGPMPEADVLSWCDRLLSALEYLHARRPPVIHGRISPPNIVIAPDGTPRLLGLLSVGEVAPDEEGRAPDADDAFAAPEQATGSYDRAADIYGVGAALYAALPGRKPLSAQVRAGGQELPPLRRLVPRISPAVEAAVLRAMALDPERRFATPGELWHALQAPPPRTRRHLGRALRTVAMVACLALAVIIAVRFLPPLLREASSLLRSAYQAAQSVAATPTQIPPVIAPTRIPMTVTPVPTARPTLTPTLPEPTATAVPPPTVTPTRAPTPQPRPSPSPAATVRRIQPPAPLAPEDGAAVSGAVEFRWYWPEPLAPDECFDLQVWRLGTEPAGIAWCRETSYRVSAPPAGPGDYLWRVQVIRVGDGQVRAYLSEPGAQRSLRWLAQE